MKNIFSTKIIFGIAFVCAVGVLSYSCSKDSNSTVKDTACVNAHLSIYDSMCNMTRNRYAIENLTHYQNDSGKQVNKTVTDGKVSSINITAFNNKTVVYNFMTFQLIDTNGGIIHFYTTQTPTNKKQDIYYNPKRDSVFICTTTNTYNVQSTLTDLDTLYTPY